MATYDNLVLGETITDSGVIEAGQNLQRGAVLGKITASGKLVLSVDTATDGSQTPYAVLNQSTDASGGDKVAPIILCGELNEGALVFGGAHTADSTRDALRDVGIYIKKSN